MSNKTLGINKEGMKFNFWFQRGTEELYTTIDVEKVDGSYYPLDVELEIRLDEKKQFLSDEYRDVLESKKLKEIEKAINKFMNAKKEAYRQFEKDTYDWK
jgi:hypothetical protein